jgi:NADPH2:quinone reductase
LNKNIKNVMRAILVKEFGDASVCKLATDVPIPAIKPGEVLIRVHATGVNPVETYVRSGTYTRLPDLPYIPGNDAAGIIEQVGAEVTKFKVGDRVFTMKSVSGTYAEYSTAHAEHVFPLPTHVSFEEGSALGVPYFTAYRALVIKGHAKPNETVLIHGASGGVGIAAVQLAKSLGLRVIGTASTEQGLQAVHDQGADLVFNHKQEGYQQDILNTTTNGEGIDLIIEMLANVNLNSDLQILKSQVGRVVVVGNRGTIEINPRLLMTKETSIHGIALSGSTLEELQMTNAYLQNGLQKGYFKPLLGKIYPLEQAAQAHTDVIYNSGTCGRLTLKI